MCGQQHEESGGVNDLVFGVSQVKSEGMDFNGGVEERRGV